MKNNRKALNVVLAVGVLAGSLLAQDLNASRHDSDIQIMMSHELAKKSQFQNVNVSVDEGIVKLTGTVEVYQQKLDAAKRARKTHDVEGVRNLIEVSGKTVADNELAARLDKSLYYDRIGYDNEFNYITASVKDGVVTLTGETRTPVDHDSALSLVDNTPGVKDVIDQAKVAPLSNFDDRIRRSAWRAIYRDPVLSRYAIDPAAPIRIVVVNGKLTLYGTVMNAMDKQIAGIRASSVFGAFSVQNDLQIANKS
jgi:hyperosmotically inducible protein